VSPSTCLWPLVSCCQANAQLFATYFFMTVIHVSFTFLNRTTNFTGRASRNSLIISDCGVIFSFIQWKIVLRGLSLLIVSCAPNPFALGSDFSKVYFLGYSRLNELHNIIRYCEGFVGALESLPNHLQFVWLSNICSVDWELYLIETVCGIVAWPWGLFRHG